MMDEQEYVEETFKQYEDQLLGLFQTCDKNQQGYLTSTEFNELLNIVQIDGSYKDGLLTVLSSNRTITFDQFKSALLNIIYNSNNEIKREISPEREVSPKLVMGAKKYGRRSKPEINEADEEHSSLQQTIDIADNPAGEEFARLNETQTSAPFEEMFPRLSKSGCRDSAINLLSSSPCIEVPSMGDFSIKAGCIHLETLQELWESQGITNVSMLLQMLGLESVTEFSIEQLIALLEEYRQSDGGTNSQNIHILIASLSLSHLQNKLIKSHLEQLMFERDKLRTDVFNANKRASLIAAEIDENHLKIENSIQHQIKLVEDKHQEELKKINQQLNNEREQLVQLSNKYETQVSQYQESVNALSTQLSEHKQQHEKLSNDYKNLLDETHKLEKTAHINKEQQQEISQLKRRIQYLETTNESMLEYETVIENLRCENTLLRDRNDEMGVELENAVRKCKLSTENGQAFKRRTDSSKEISAPSAGKLRKYNTEQDVSMPGLTAPDGFPTYDSLPSSTPIKSSYDIDLLDNCTLQTEFPNHLETEPIYSTYIKPRSSPLSSNTVELQFSTFQNEIQKLLSEKKFCDEENTKLKRENIELKNKLNKISTEYEHQGTIVVSDEIKFKRNMDEQILNVKNNSCAFDISVDDLKNGEKSANLKNQSKNISDQDKSKQNYKNFKHSTNSNDIIKMECTRNNSNFLVRGHNDINFNMVDEDDKFKTMTIQTDDINQVEDNVMETMILDKHGKELKHVTTETCMDEDVSDNTSNVFKNGTNSGENNSMLNDEKLDSKVETIKTYDISIKNSENIDQNLLKTESKDSETLKETTNEIVETNKSIELRDGIIDITSKVQRDEDNRSDIKQWLDVIKNNSTKWTRETLEDCLKAPHPLWKLATLETFLNEREELLNKCFYLETYVNKFEAIKIEKDKVEEKCKDLEFCLEQMKVEFEKLEEYWTNKIDDERKLFEQEQAMNTEKYIELELKINEYAELFSKVDEDAEMMSGLKSFNKLPTIDETEMYERQVLDLEQEFQEYKIHMDAKMKEKDNLIQSLNQTISSLENSKLDQSASDSNVTPDVSVELVAHQTNSSFENKCQKTEPLKDISAQEIFSPLDIIGSHIALYNSNPKDWTCVRINQEMYTSPKKFSDFNGQTEEKGIQQDSFVQTDNLLDQFDSLASKLDPEKVLQYEKALKGENSVKYQKKMFRKSKKSNNNSDRDLETNIPSDDTLQLEMKLHKQNVHRLAKTDLLVKDLYVRNCLNMAKIHSLEQELLVEKNKNCTLEV